MDAERVEAGGVEQGEDDIRVQFAGEDDAVLVVGLVDCGVVFVAEEGGVAHQEEMGFGEAAVGAAGGGEVGGAAFRHGVGVGLVDRAEGAVDGLVVLVDDFHEQGVEVGEVEADGGGGDVHGDGEVADAQVAQAVQRQEVPAGGENPGAAFELFGGEPVWFVLEVFDLAAEEVGRNFHNGVVSGDDG